MHFARLISASIIIAAFVAGESVHADQIQWAPDLDTARRMAVQQNKPLLLHFYTDSCPPCRGVERNVFPDASVVEAVNANYVPLKVNAEKSTALRDHFQVKQWPTDVVATVDGRAIHSMVTPQSAKGYVQKLMTVAMAQRPAPPTQAQFASQPRQQQQQQQYQAPQTPAVQQQAAVQNQLAQGQSAPGSRWSPGGPTPPPLAQSTAVARRPGIPVGQQAGSNMGSPYVGYGQQAGQVPAQGYGAAQAPANQNQAYGQPAQRPYVAPAKPATMISNPYAGQAQQQVAAQPQQQVAAQLQQPAPRTQQQYAAQPRQHPIAQQPVAQQPAGQALAQQQAQQQPQRQQVQPQQQQVAQQPAVMPQQRSDVTPIQPTDGPVIGLDGRCPVTLVTEGKWKKGAKQWGAIHRGHTYLFASPDHQKLFLSNPDKYSPVLAGMDIVQLAEAGKIVQGNRRFGVLFDDDGNEGPRDARIYLFDSTDSRNRFENSPDTFLRPVLQAMQEGSLDTLLR